MVAIVTGGSRGIGLGICKCLARDGFDLCIVGTKDFIEVENGIKDIKIYGKDAIYIKCDISDVEKQYEIIDKVVDYYGRIDILVNNAGVAPKIRTDILELNTENFDHLLNINLRGTFFLTQKVANEMIKLVKNDKICNPKIITISSVSANTSSPNRAEYCISKAGLSMMVTLFADRLADENIFVYEVRPGIIRTDMTEKVAEKYDKLISEGITPIKRWGEPNDVGEAVSALCSGKFNFSTGEVINVDGGFHIQRL